MSANPLIIIGMHRSGTSMLCRILGDLGVFFGADQTSVNHESGFFVQINRWLFEQCGASWDRPAAVRELFSDKIAYGCFRDYVANVLRSSYSRDYLGKRVPGGIFSLARPWGWKDPRTTYTLPLWLDLFPEARVLSVVRNGVDVAQSLKVREERYLEKKKIAVSHGKILARRELLPRKLDYREMLRLTMSLRCLTLEGGFSLWEEYMEVSRSHVANQKGMTMEVRYEDLLANPKEILLSVSEFCGLAIKGEEVNRAASGIKVERANAFTLQSDLMSFYEKNRQRLSKYAY